LYFKKALNDNNYEKDKIENFSTVINKFPISYDKIKLNPKNIKIIKNIKTFKALS
jgi:hypothetical protein